MRDRYLAGPIRQDLGERMVFLAGPRQVGKTTLARGILEAEGAGLYLSFDRKDDRRTALAAEWPANGALVVLDELHKYRPWKRWIKGEFDRHRSTVRFLVTGSARLDVYRRGGDSLQGRYHHYRLHPFTAAELSGAAPPALEPGDEPIVPQRAERETLQHVLQFGGFPEPCLSGTERTLRRWRKDRLDRFFREDVRDLETIRDLSAMELLADMLVDRVGSLLSLNSLREDLEVAHKTVARWIEVLERLYFLFRLTPYSHRAIRGLRKMAKSYLWEPTGIKDRGARFENLVALHLLKLCHWLEDTEGYRTELRYLRDKEGREVDFLVLAGGRPWFAVEAKTASEELDPSIAYFKQRLAIPHCYQISLDGRRDYVKDGVRCLPAHVFLAGLA